MSRVLLIAPSFFGYHKDITDELAARGYEVDYMPDRPSESVLFKSLGRINYSIVNHSINRYCDILCEMVSNSDYALVLFVGGMSICFSRKQIERLRDNSSAAFGLYLWDSLSNCQRIGDSIDLFDFVYSFEPNDCKLNGISFLPLFYTKEYSEVANMPHKGFSYDACFIGSVHQVSKFENIKRIVEKLESEGATVYCHYYMPSHSVALLRQIKDPIYKDTTFKYDALGRRDIARIYAASRTVIDSPQAGQSGLTMRTLETLGARRRLVTANTAVKQYDFYDYGNVFVCTNDELPDMSFVGSDPNPLPSEVYERYSISSWLNHLLTGLE